MPKIKQAKPMNNQHFTAWCSAAKEPGTRGSLGLLSALLILLTEHQASERP